MINNRFNVVYHLLYECVIFVLPMKKLNYEKRNRKIEKGNVGFI